MFSMLDFIKKTKKNCINWTFDGSLTQGDVVWCIRVYTISLLIKVKWLTNFRPPDKSQYLKIIILISQPNICCGCLKEPSQ